MNLLDIPVSSLSFACITTACLSLLAVTPRAQAPDAKGKPDPEVVALLARVDAARGKSGTQPLSLAIEGTYAVTFEGAATAEPVAKGTFQDLFVGADLARHTSHMGEFGKMERGVLKGLAWEVDPALGAKVYQGVHEATLRRYFGLLRGASSKEMYADVARTGTQAIDGKDHVVLRMTPAVGKADTWYIDAEHATLSRVDIALPAPESTDPNGEDAIDAQIMFADWKLENGMRHARRRAIKMGPATVAFVCTKVAVGAPLETEQFAVPEAVTKLDRTPAQPAVDASGKPVYQVVDKQAQAVASIRVTCKADEISATLAVLLPEVMAHLTATGAQMAGAPFSRYHKMSEDEIDLEAGIPVAKPIEAKGRIKNSELPAGRVVTAWHVGQYEKLGAAHAALQAYADGKQFAASGGPWEVYWTDPGMVTDPAKWRTQLFLPIK